MTRLSDNYNFQKLCPDLAIDWHPTKNGNLTPKDMMAGSCKKVWWVCSKGHEWQAIIRNRSSGAGCPFCAGRAVCEDNCLQTINPILAIDWHPTKNGNLTPKDVIAGSYKKVWWVCYRGHEWEATINNRSQGRSCPYCSGKKVCLDNCLKTINPKLAKEWHPTKNDTLTPRDVTPNSNKKVWWLCSKNKNHEWQATICHRNNDNGCPHCFKKKRKTKTQKI